MKYTVITPKRFKKDLVRCQKRGLNMRLIYDAILLLQETGKLPRKYHPHKLVSQKQETWELTLLFCKQELIPTYSERIEDNV